MDDAPFFIHLDDDYRWRVYIIDVSGNMIAISPPYFDMMEAEQAMKVLARPMAA